MRRVLLSVLAIAAGAVQAASLEAIERQRLVAHLELTTNWLPDEVAALSEAQLRFRPSPGVWNILEVIEHLNISEPIYWRQFQEAMRRPARGRASSASDAGILWYGIDRTHKQKAIPSEDVQGPPRDLAAGLAAYAKLRRQMIEYARTTTDDLRAHIVEREQCDAYQWLLLISTHAQRHILQIREIKADRKFPHN